MLNTLFTVILYLNILVSLASLVFAVILLRRAKNQIYFNFGMSVLFLFFWTTGMVILFFNFIPSISSRVLIDFSFLFGAWIMHYFYIFTLKFPFSVKNDFYKIFIVYVATFLISATTFIPNFYTEGARLNFPFLYLDINPVGLLLFSSYFLIVAILAFKNLVDKYSKSDGIHKLQLRKIIIGTLIAVVANFILSITIYFFVDFDTTPIGILFIFAVLVYVYSILFSKKYR